MSRFKRYAAVPKIGAPSYFRYRWMAKLVCWFTGWDFVDCNDQVTL